MLLFGRKLVPPWAHFIAALMVALGTLFSSFWILAANSWMQTPAGYEIVDGRFFPGDWLQIIFNPSFPYRLAHTVVALLRHDRLRGDRRRAPTCAAAASSPKARVMLSMTLWLLTVLVPLQILIGDLHGLNTLRAPAGQARGDGGALGDRRARAADPVRHARQEAESNRFDIEVPLLGSLILAHDVERRGPGPEGLSRAGPRRRWPCRSSPSASWSASAC